MTPTIKVLVVDDEERFRWNLMKLLSVKGIQAEGAASGEEALAAAAATKYDVILLDVKMPGMGGVEAMKKLKAAGLKAQVIFLTGHASVDDAVDGLQLGAFDYLLKPCATDLLLEKITTAYERKLSLERSLTG
jgi:DNA-binding NtrC family response regulator